MTFRTIPDDGTPLRVVIVGVGGMGQAWLRAVADCSEVELVGLVDLNTEAAQAVATGLSAPVAVGSDVVEVAARSGGQAVIDVTVPEAHHPVTTAALFAGLPVLGEKPAASTVAQALSLAAAAEVTGQLFMVSQSRRYNHHLWSFKDQIAGIGGAGVLTTEFFKAPHFGGFRDEMDHPLLLDMAIHQLDAARFLLESDPVSVYCQEFNPSWSWYRGDAGCVAIFEMESGAQYVFTGTWCSPGLETSWNGSWRASGEYGSARWNGDDAPELELVGSSAVVTAGAGALLGDGIAGSLREFVDALRTGVEPMAEVHGNVLSLAMVEAAIESTASGARVSLEASMSRALDGALRAERRDDVGLVLRAWQAAGGYGARMPTR
jgi:predicted dehydrogenase